MPDTATIYSDAPDLDTLGGRLSRARDAIGLSTGELAQRLGVQTTTLKAWESDRSQPRANRLSMLAGVLNVSPSWLLHGLGTAPLEEGSAELIRTIGDNLGELRRLHAETGAAITRLELDLRRLAGAD